MTAAEVTAAEVTGAEVTGDQATGDQVPAAGPRHGTGGISGFTGGADVAWLLLLGGLALVEEIDRVAFGVFGPDIRDTFGVSDGAYLGIVNAATAVPVLAALPLARLADRGGRVRVAWRAALAWTALSVLTGISGLVGVFALFVVVRVGSGIGKTTNEPVHPALLADTHGSDVLPRVTAVYRLAPIIAGITAPLSGLLEDAIGWRLAFSLLALPAVPLALALRRRGEPLTATPLEHQAGLKELAGIPTIRRYWWGALFFGAAAANLTTLPSLFFEKVYGLDATGRGVALAIGFVIGAAGLPASAALATRALRAGHPENLPTVGACSVLVFAAGLAIAGFSPWLAGSVVGAVFAVAGFLGIYPPAGSLIPLVVPAHLRASAFGSVLIAIAVGAIVSVPVTSLLVNGPGYRATFLVLAGLVTVGALIQLTVRRFVVPDLLRPLGEGGSP